MKNPYEYIFRPFLIYNSPCNEHFPPFYVIVLPDALLLKEIILVMKKKLNHTLVFVFLIFSSWQGDQQKMYAHAHSCSAVLSCNIVVRNDALFFSGPVKALSSSGRDLKHHIP